MLSNTRSTSLTDTHVTVIINGTPYTVAKTDARFPEVIRLLKAGASDEALIKACDTTIRIAAWGGNQFTVKDGVVRYNGDMNVPPRLVRRMLELMALGLPVDNLANFYARLQKNPSNNSVTMLYEFLEHKNIPIAQDGRLVMYKAVRNDYMDKHSGTILNKPGCIPTMPRNAVCDDIDVGCHTGLHCGSIEYVKGFASNYGVEGGDRIVLVAVDPADVVSVPRDCSFQKVRTCKYEVLEEFKGELPGTYVNTTKSVYDTVTDQSDLDDESDPDNFCDECGGILDEYGDCNNSDCTCSDSYDCSGCCGGNDVRQADVVMSIQEFEAQLAKAREEGRIGVINKIASL